MNNLSSFLQRFKKILSLRAIESGVIVDVMKKTLGVDINPSDVKIKNGVLYVNTSPIIKNMIFLKKKLLLQNINSGEGSKIADIR